MKTALVTGANRGLGKGFVDYLTSQNIFVFAGVRNLSSSQDIFKDNPLVRTVELDVSNDESIANAFEEVSGLASSLDYLINNAGVNKDSATNNQKEKVSKLGSLDRNSFLTMFDINSISPLLITQAFLSLLQSDPSFVIQISSCRASTHDEMGNSSANYGYRASKTALNMMTFCSLFDLPQNVKTFAVHPGSVRSDMNTTGEDDPIEQAQKIIQITENWQDKLNGKFLRYDGSLYPL